MDDESADTPSEDQEREPRPPAEGIRITGATQAGDAASGGDEPSEPGAVDEPAPEVEPEPDPEPASGDAEGVTFPFAEEPPPPDPGRFGAVPLITADSPPPPGVGEPGGPAADPAPAETFEPAEPVEPAETFEPAEAVEPVAPAEPVEPVEPVAMGDAVDGEPRWADAADHDEPAPVEAVEDVGPATEVGPVVGAAADPDPQPAAPVEPAPVDPVAFAEEPADAAALGGEAAAVDHPDEDLDAWSGVGSQQPRWRDASTEHHQSDDFADLADDDTRVGALDESQPDPQDPQTGFFSFDDTQGGAGGPGRPDPFMTAPPSPAPDDQAADAQPSGRNVPVAVVTGVALAAIALVLFAIGPAAAMVLVVAVLVLSVAEFYNSLRRSGYHPDTLIGLATCACLPLAVYWRGESGFALVLFLVVVVSILWHLFGIGHERPLAAISVTLLGIVYVGVLGSFAALLLKFPNGIGLLLGAIIATVGYDVGAFFIGRAMGHTPLSAASPNKTTEGLIGGALVAVLLSAIVVGQIHPWEFPDSLFLGFVVAVAAPLGDLSESLIKRDLGIKDMGDILPGHGGFLDRFDGLLFALPATYYLARVAEIF